MTAHLQQGLHPLHVTRRRMTWHKSRRSALSKEGHKTPRGQQLMSLPVLSFSALRGFKRFGIWKGSVTLCCFGQLRALFRLCVICLQYHFIVGRKTCTDCVLGKSLAIAHHMIAAVRGFVFCFGHGRPRVARRWRFHGNCCAIHFLDIQTAAVNETKASATHLELK